MKQLIFKGQYGWYILASNYKDKNDLAYINLHFYKGIEPIGQEKDKMWIDIQEASLTCYKGKVGMSIFGWEETLSPKKQAEENALNNTQKRVEAKNNEIKIEQENLPFY